MDKTLRFGILGSGFIALTHAEALHRAAGAEVAAIAGGRKAGELADQYGARRESSVESLIEAADVDAVAICTPHALHASQAIACLEQGKVQDARAYRMTRKIAKDHPRLKDLTRHEVKEKARRAAFIVQFDPEGALRTLPKLLPTDEERRDALDVIKRIVSWRPDIAPEHAAVIKKVEEFFGYADSPVRAVEPTAAAS